MNEKSCKMEQLTCSNTYMRIGGDAPGMITAVYDVGKIHRVTVENLHDENDLSHVEIEREDKRYVWDTRHIYRVGYIMYGIPVSQDGRFLFAQQNMRGLYCLDAETGLLVWKTKSRAEYSYVLVGKQSLCCSKARDEIQLIGIETGEVLRSHKTPFINRFMVLTDDYILNQTRAKTWEVLSSQTLEVVRSIADRDFCRSRPFWDRDLLPK